MSAITFDTLKYAERLEKAGATRELAKAEAEALAEVFEAGTHDLPTRADIKAEVATIGAEMREMRAEIMGEIKLNRWMLAALIGLAIANFAKQYL